MLENLKSMFENAEEFVQSKNFYFENHICKKSGETKRVNLDLKLSKDNDDKIVKFGMCQECKTLFYKYDFESNSF